MQKQLILKKQKNEVLETLKKHGLDPGEFRWEAVDIQPMGHDTTSVPVLQHPPTEAEFIFDMRGQTSGSLWGTWYSPAPDKPREYECCHNWTEMWYHVEHWAQALKQEIEAPDLWAAIAQESALAASAASLDDTPFTPEEKSRLEAAVNEIQQYLESVSEMQEEQAKYVRGQLQYLRDAIRRMGRRDWMHTAIGVLTTIALTVGADQARDLFRFAGQQISNAIGLAATSLQQLLSG